MYAIIENYGTPSARLHTPIWHDLRHAERTLAEYEYAWPNERWSVHDFLKVIDQKRSSAENPYPLRAYVRGAAENC